MKNKKNGMTDYVGKYRVVCDFARNTLKPNKDDTFIHCQRNGTITRFDDYTLIYYRDNASPKNVKDKISKMGVNFVDESGDNEVSLKFNECDLEKLVHIFKPNTKGADINPRSKRNLKLFDWYKTVNKSNL